MFRAKKIGKFFFQILIQILILSYVTLCAEVHVQLALLDSSGKRAQELALDQIGILQITISGQDDGVTMPEIDQLADFVLLDKRFVSTVHVSINGVRTNKKIFQFTIEPKRTGSFVVGPAYVKVNKQHSYSNVLKINVVKETQTSAEEPKLILRTDKKNVYPGEPFMCAIRFYPNKEASLEGVSQPDFSGFRATQLEGPFVEKERVKGVEVSFIEWRTVLTALKPGEHRINPVTAVYKVQRKKSDRQTIMGLDIFDQFFSQIDQRQVSSNAHWITVQELPPTTKHVDGVGRFEKIEAFIEPSEAMQGEGVVLKLVVHAKDHNVDLLQFPHLQVPESLKYYESKSYVRPGAHDASKSLKVFEYILQGSQPGKIKIPKQKIHIFNYETQKYEILESNELSLTIKKDVSKKAEPEKIEKEEQVDTQSSSKRLPFIKDGTSHYQDTRSINIYLWLFLCFLPWCMYLIHYAWSGLRVRMWAHEPLKRRILFKKARKKLTQLEKTSASEAIYDLLRELYAEYYMIQMHTVTHEMLKNIISVADAHYKPYTEFIDILVEHSFGDKKRNLEDHQKLCIEARQWLAIIEKHIS